MNLIVEAVVSHVMMVYYILEAIVLFFVPTRFRSKDVKGEIVLITGAGSGIGRLLALRFAKLGSRLVLWDVNNKSNEQTARECRELGARVNSYACDISQRNVIYETANKVKDEVGDVDILINNAGIVTGKKFLDCPDALIEKTMNVNSVAHFWIAKAFLPSMKARNHGHVVTIASAAGLFGQNGLADYCASKHAAVGFDESIRTELAMDGKSGVHTTVVCPFYINTGMFDGVQTRFPSILPILDPHYCVDKIMEAILTNAYLLCLPRVIYLLAVLKSLFPVKAVLLANDFYGTSNSMDDFRGRLKKN